MRNIAISTITMIAPPFWHLLPSSVVIVQNGSLTIRK